MNDSNDCLREDWFDFLRLRIFERIDSGKIDGGKFFKQKGERAISNKRLRDFMIEVLKDKTQRHKHSKIINWLKSGQESGIIINSHETAIALLDSKTGIGKQRRIWEFLESKKPNFDDSLLDFITFLFDVKFISYEQFCKKHAQKLAEQKRTVEVSSIDKSRLQTPLWTDIVCNTIQRNELRGTYRDASEKEKSEVNRNIFNAFLKTDDEFDIQVSQFVFNDSNIGEQAERTQSVITSALSISCLLKFSDEKVDLLHKLARHRTLEVRKRALLGLVLPLFKNYINPRNREILLESLLELSRRSENYRKEIEDILETLIDKHSLYAVVGVDAGSRFDRMHYLSPLESLSVLKDSYSRKLDLNRDVGAFIEALISSENISGASKWIILEFLHEKSESEFDELYQDLVTASEELKKLREVFPGYLSSLKFAMLFQDISMFFEIETLIPELKTVNTDEKFFNSIASLFDQFPKIQLLYANFLKGNKDYQKALDNYLIGSGNPNFHGFDFQVASVQKAIGYSFIKIEKYQEAFSHYEKAYKVTPEDVEILVDLFECNLYFKNFKKAKELIYKAASIDVSALNFSYCGIVEMILKNSMGALNQFIKAVRSSDHQTILNSFQKKEWQFMLITNGVTQKEIKQMVEKISRIPK